MHALFYFFCNYINIKICKLANKEETELLLIYVISMTVLIVLLMLLLPYLFNVLKERGTLKFMQVFATSELTEKELQLAIEAVKNFEELEESIINGTVEGFEIEFASDDFKEFIIGKEEEG